MGYLALANTPAIAAQHTGLITLDDGRTLSITGALAALVTTAAAAEYVRRTVTHYVHPVDPPAWGRSGDVGAVVDQRSCLHQLEGLRVANAPIMPTIPRANTNLTCIMIGE